MVAMVVLFFCSCDGKKDKTLRELKDVSGCQVKFPDVPLFHGTKSKILVLVADTGECSPCSMGVNEWYVYRLDMEERHLDADIVFVLPEGMRLPSAVDSLLLQYGLYRYYGYETFMKLNPKPTPVKPSEPPEPVHEIKKDIVSDEEKRRMMLEKERENTNPDDMLALVNPLEVKEKVNEQVKEKELVSVAELSNMYAGNTQGIAGDDLKAIAPQKTALAEKISETADMKIANESASDDEENDEETVKEYRGKKTTDNLIEKLNKNLAQQRKENVRAHRTITLNTINGGKQTLQHPLNIDYQKQIIEATGAIPTENPVVEEEKQAELAAAKKHKLKDFVLEDDTPEQEEEPAQEEEFEDYDSTGQIWADLCASHKGLRIRLGLLTVITAISVIISALNDFNLFAKLGLGASFNFINGTTGDVNSLIYIYLVLGVLGFAICSTAISNGAIKLFTGKADCDSVCALTSVLALIGGVIALVDVQTFKLGHSFIYLSTALVGLMFNTIGKIYMISRAKRNFKFVSGDSQKYYAEVIDGEERVSALTRAVGEKSDFCFSF